MGYLSSRRANGTIPLYRLRLQSRTSYLVTASKAERDKLVAQGTFRYEGILGYVAAKPGAGRLAICRVSKNSVWKIIPASQASKYKGQGWTGCGGAGYSWTKA